MKPVPFSSGAFVLTIIIGLISHVSVSAQVGMVVVGSEALVTEVLGQRNDCRDRYPTLKAALDRGLEVMIQQNLDSYTRETWVKLSALSTPDVRKLSQEQCEQLPKTLAAWDWKPLVVEEQEVRCQYAVRTLEFEKTSAIGASAEESSDGPRLTEIMVGGPAATGDLRVGDVIREFGGSATPTVCQLALAVARSKAGNEIEIKLLRNGILLRTSVIPTERTNSR